MKRVRLFSLLMVIAVVAISSFATLGVRADDSADNSNDGGVIANNKLIKGWVDPAQFAKIYNFDAQPNESLFLVFANVDPEGGPNIALANETKFQTVASLNTEISGNCLRIAP